MKIEKIRSKYAVYHDNLTRDFYRQKRAGKVGPEQQLEFDLAHQILQENLDAELARAGYVKPMATDLEAEVAGLAERVATLEAKKA